LDEQPGWRFKQKRELGTTFKQRLQRRRQQDKVRLHLNSLLIIVINFEHAPHSAALSSGYPCLATFASQDGVKAMRTIVYFLMRIEACNVFIFTLKVH